MNAPLNVLGNNPSIFQSIFQSIKPTTAMVLGNKFEAKVLEHIKKIFPDSTIDLSAECPYADPKSRAYTKTLDALLNPKCNVVLQGYVKNWSERQHGIADIIIRGRCVSKLIANAPGALCADSRWYCIDVKFATISLRTDGHTMVSTKDTRYYACQVGLYAAAIQNMTGQTPVPLAFVLGRGYRCAGTLYTNCFNRLGHVRLDPPPSDLRDASIIFRSNVSKRNASDIGKLWQCGMKHIVRALEAGVTSYRDRALNASMLGFKGATASILNAIISVNRGRYATTPRAITRKFAWRRPGGLKDGLEVFLSIETMSNVLDGLEGFPERRVDSPPYMVGMVLRGRHGAEHVNIMADDLMLGTSEVVDRACDAILKRDSKRKRKVHVYHWGGADEKIWKTYGSGCDNLVFIDLCQVAKDIRFGVKGCFGFGLSDILDNLSRHGLVKCPIVSRGLNSWKVMKMAWSQYQILDKYQNPKRDFKRVIKYSRSNCDRLVCILDYFRRLYK